MRTLLVSFQSMAHWTAALLRRRAGRIMAMSIGVALAVGLLASLGTFLSASKATMTTRAVDAVAVDWQVQVQPGADATTVANLVVANAHVAKSLVVDFATSPGLGSSTGSTSHTTGEAQIVGLPDGYQQAFPQELRILAGQANGVLLYQQTAANLAARPGDSISVNRAWLPPATVTVVGVVDLPQADSLFQKVGAPPGSQPQAPPDNVVLLPAANWHQLFDPVAANQPDQVQTQIHARTDRSLPTDPVAAYAEVTGRAQNLELALTGHGIVGDNLAATLAAARTDALYAQVLFLFLGAPGAVLAGLLTAAVAGSGRERRRKEQALLRTRGATTRQLLQLAAAEATAVGVLGGAIGLALAAAIGRLLFGATPAAGGSAGAVVWPVAAGLAGLAIALAAIVLPARRDARDLTVSASLQVVGRAVAPRWLRWRLDLITLGLAGLVYWFTSRNGYKLVLAVEGVPSISVSYWAFAGPALLWAGVGLLSYRLTITGLSSGRPVLAAALRPLSGALSDTVAASLRRQRRAIARGVALVALTIGFAASTATFNATYRQQAEVDAVLTNGADVTVTPAPGTNIGPSSQLATTIAANPGVQHVEALQHRFAYVGNDLQDLFGVNPATIVDSGRLQDAYFQGGTARQLINQLATRPDSILVSAETVRDFQLLPGDQIILRLQDAGPGKTYIDVPFHYAGVAKEFPTAPRDSFLLANASYIAAKTGNDAIGAFLVDTGGRNIVTVSSQLKTVTGNTANVTDIESSRKIIGSSLTAVDLHGLTQLELGFAFALGAAATGVTLWLGLNERRRTFALATALGATRRQLGGFVWSEAAIITLLGTLLGAIGAWALSAMLVNVLQGVFDPPPANLAVPLGYLAALGAVAALSTTAAAIAVIRASHNPRVELLRA